MTTLRLSYPDHVSGGLDTYYFGGRLLPHLLPANPDQPWQEVPIDPPTDSELETHEGVYGLDQVEAGIDAAWEILQDAQPARVITAGGSCVVSQAPFDYLHGRYGDSVGVLWIDAHADVSTPADDYPYAHAMTLSSLLGDPDVPISAKLRNAPFKSEQVLYVGLQELLDHQRSYLEGAGIVASQRTDQDVATSRIAEFVAKFDYVLVHLDIDVLDPARFHSTYFANSELTGDGSGGGKMTMEKLADVLATIDQTCNVVGLTVAEYLPFDEQRLHNALRKLSIFQ